MARTIIDTLVTRMEFDNDTTGLKAATRSIGAFKTNIVSVLAPVVALFSGGLLINSIANAADEMIKFADATGIAVGDLQDLEFAVQRQGGSISGLRSSITNMSKALGELSLDKGLAKDVFEALGLSAFDADGEVKSATSSLLELNVAFQTLSKSEQVGFGKKLGLDIGTIQLLQTAPKELQALIAQSKEYGRITEADARQAAAFNDQLTNLSTIFGRLAQSVGLSVLPVLTDFLTALQDVITFIRSHSEFFGILTEAVLLLGTAFLLLNTRLLSLAATSLGASIALLANPFFLIGAAAVALGVGLALLYDDFLSWRDGSEAVFGGFFEFIDKKIDKFLNGFEKIRTFLREFTGPLRDFLGIDDIGVRNNIAGARSFSGGVSSRSTVIGKVLVTVNAPGADAAEISATVGAKLSEQLRAAAQDNDSSIAR